MPRRSLVPTVVSVLAVALVGLLVYGVVAKDENTTLDDAVRGGRRPAAPNAGKQLPLLDGSGKRAVADLSGKVVVLNFWASWCDPCRAEAPLLEKAHRQLTKTGIGTVLGATYNDATNDSRAFEREFKITYPSVRDVGTELAKGFGTRALPETFVLDRSGRIVAISRGQLDQRFLDRALAKAQRDEQHGGEQ
ncbi:MAG: TlpA family protein disulfide reductase [Solirubrobacterales bacterium]|nr:TlpA family protein disulfide reductase [Solirubrobacterales bacterium]